MLPRNSESVSKAPVFQRSGKDAEIECDFHFGEPSGGGAVNVLEDCEGATPHSVRYQLMVPLPWYYHLPPSRQEM